MSKLLTFLQGKKTYISAAVLAFVAIAGWWFGAINDTNFMALLSIAGAAAGLGAKSERNAQLVLGALETVRAAQAGHTSTVQALKSVVVQNQNDLAKLAGALAQPQTSINLSVPGRVVVPVPTPSQAAIREAESTGAPEAK